MRDTSTRWGAIVRRITVRLASNCGSAYIHSPIYIQLSTGNFWIPPRQPLRFPTTGDFTGDGHPISDIAEKLHQAVSQAQVVGGNEIRDVSLISTHPHVNDEGIKQSDATVYEFSFTTLDSRIGNHARSWRSTWTVALQANPIPQKQVRFNLPRGL